MPRLTLLPVPGIIELMRRLGSVLLLLSLGCDPVFFAGLTDDSDPAQPTFAIGSNPDFSGRAWVYAVVVRGRPCRLSPDADSTLAWRTFWSIHVDSSHKTAPLSLLTYGVLPLNFHSIRGPDSLRRDFTYSCEFHCAGLSPTVYFELTGSPERPLLRELPGRH